MGVIEDLRSTAVSWLDRAVSVLPPRSQAVARRLVDRRILLAASSLAFYGLISVLPLALLAIAFTQATLGQDAVQQLSEASDTTGQQGGPQLIRSLSRGARSLSAGVFVAALWASTAYGGGLRRALREFSPRDEKLSGLRGRFLGLGFVLALPAIVYLGVPAAFVLTRVTGQGPAATIAGWGLALLAGTAGATVVLTLSYRAFTPEDRSWSALAKGSSVTAGAIAFASLLTVVYLRFSGVEQRYGNPVIGLIIVLGVWLLVVNALVLAGYHAIIEIESREDGGDSDEDPSDDPGANEPGDVDGRVE